MITPEQLTDLKNQYGHIFEIEENGNLTLKDRFGIPPFKMIFVEGGEFIMGNNRLSDATEHKVLLSNFFVAEVQVTQELYHSVSGNNLSRFDGLKKPVEQINWYRTVKFCNIINKKLDLPIFCDDNYNLLGPNRMITNEIEKVKGFRLPTEAEWEYSAKGGILAQSNMLFAGSNNLKDIAWYNENSNYETKPVGLKFPNQLEIYDLCGNVWEWCWDWYGHYTKNLIKNPAGSASGTYKVFRGGSWRSNNLTCHLANRYDGSPDVRDDDIGFRLVFKP